MANTTTPDTGPDVTPTPGTPQAAVRPQEAPTAPRSANSPGSTPGAATGPVQPRDEAQMDRMEAAPRPWTPDRANADGSTTIVLKRACNGCGHYVGDATDQELFGPLRDVRTECAHCAPLVALEAAGARTWQLTERSFGRVANEIDRMRPWVFTKGYWREVDGKLQVVGLRVGQGETRVVAFFGDWLIRQPDGTFTVHKAPEAVSV